MTPTPEQDLILAEAKTSNNLLISALAGAAKTSTLVMLAHKLPLQPTLSVAFNKKIADEMGKRMPSHITSSTLNSIGHRTWGNRLGKRLQIDSGKSYELVKALVDDTKGEDHNTLNELFASILRALRSAKSSGYVPQGQYSQLGHSLVDGLTFYDSIAPDLDYEPDEFFQSKVDLLLEKSIALGYEGKCDFDDQLYLPTLFGASWPKYPCLMVDEAQDLSPLNHLMLEKMYGGRLIAVGDPNQSIYGFRGAHHSSMDVLKQRFEMKQLQLSVSFRCPQRVVQNVWKRCPQMKWFEGALEGKVERLDKWTSALVPDGGAIICRNNAPLFYCALAFIKAGRGVKIVGSDLGPKLIKLLTKMGEADTPQDEVLSNINKWENAELVKARESRKAPIQDRAASLRVFASAASKLSSMITYVEHLFAATGLVELMTGHKSKGLEYEVVFYLDSWRVPSKYARRAAEEGDRSKLEQELNLDYVISTRAKKELYYVNLEDFT